MSAKKVTMADIAKEARVGIATVDRVLNKRTPVKESTERKVLESARRLGFALEQSRYRLAADPTWSATAKSRASPMPRSRVPAAGVYISASWI